MMQKSVPIGFKRRAAFAKTFADSFKSRLGLSAGDAISRSHDYLSANFGQLKGLPQKLGQILSLKEDLAEEQSSFSNLRESSDAILSGEDFISLVSACLGADQFEQFATIDPMPLAAASLSQVHRATLKTGEEVVVKLQYPNIKAAIDQDLHDLGWLGKPLTFLGSEFDLSDYRTEIQNQIEQELDYKKEVENIEAFQSLWEDDQSIRIPGVYKNLSNAQVLVMDYVVGERYEDVVKNWSHLQKISLAKSYLEFQLKSLFQYGVIHGDPHPGNFRFQFVNNHPQITVYDFGNVIRLSLREKQNLKNFFSHLLEDVSEDRLFFDLAEIGFDEFKLRSLTGQFAEVLKLLFRPFLYEGLFETATWNRREKIEELVGAKKWDMRTSAPAHFIYFVRWYQGLNYYLSHLPAVSWRSILIPYLMHANENQEVPPAPKVEKTEDAAFVLRVKVEKNGLETVSLSMPGDCVRRLDEVIPSDVRDKIMEQGIPFFEKVDHFKNLKTLAPEKIFSIKEKFKTVSVSLEKQI
ncbi:MAG: AarF/ABC1/UbiB kinase family protein [Deltaproteobacteria bacterium]|nr:AarF/ABC1/UbiB kinase family protein [Deltaproteobacteria bacterium]